jgi:hypothetical protein
LKTEISISTSLVGKKKCCQCKKNLDCFSIIYNNKFIEYFICNNCYNYDLDKLHYIAWWLKVNLKKIYDRSIYCS